MVKNIICALCITVCLIFTSSKALAKADYLRLHLFVGTELEDSFLGYDGVDYWAGELSITLGTFLDPEETIFADIGIKYSKFEFSDYENDVHVDDADYVGADVGLGYLYHFKAIKANLMIRVYAGLGYWSPEKDVDPMADHGVTGDLGIMIVWEFPLGKDWFFSAGPGFSHQSKARLNDNGVNSGGGFLGVKKRLPNGIRPIFRSIRNFFRKLF